MIKKRIIFLTLRSVEETAQILDRGKIAKKLKRNAAVKAESFEDRDKLARVWAAYCIEMAEHFKNAGKPKLQLQWMKLAARLLHMSLKPKKLADLDEIKKTLAQIKKQQANAV
jgi:hypothetical protein